MERNLTRYTIITGVVFFITKFLLVLEARELTRPCGVHVRRAALRKIEKTNMASFGARRTMGGVDAG